MNIVSLLPSATEIICALGLENQLVGVTHECDFPESVRSLQKVTRTLIPSDTSSANIDNRVRERLKKSQSLYSLNMETLSMLKPDLIVTQALCEVCAVAEDEVEEAICALPNKPQVVNLEPKTLTEVIGCIHQVAGAAGVKTRGAKTVEKKEKSTVFALPGLRLIPKQRLKLASVWLGTDSALPILYSVEFKGQ